MRCCCKREIQKILEMERQQREQDQKEQKEKEEAEKEKKAAEDQSEDKSKVAPADEQDSADDDKDGDDDENKDEVPKQTFGEKLRLLVAKLLHRTPFPRLVLLLMPSLYTAMLSAIIGKIGGAMADGTGLLEDDLIVVVAYLVLGKCRTITCHRLVNCAANTGTIQFTVEQCLTNCLLYGRW